MNITAKKENLGLGVFILVFFYFVTPMYGQCEKKDIFDFLPDLAQKRLVERLNLRVEYEKQQQWGELFDLFYPPSSDETNYLERKKEFIKINIDPSDPRDHIMINFIPQIVTPALEIEKDSYFIEGCGTFRFKGNVIKENTIIVAHLIGKEWFFSSFGEVAPNNLCEQ